MEQYNSKVIENAQLFYGCLHFKYNGKKYLYGLTEELLTCGQQTQLLSKLNGTYEPSERQKKQKSSLLLKKQKTLLKIDYIILPRKACEHQYLWHFQQLTKKLDCKHFLILPLIKEQRKNKDPGIDFTTKKRILGFFTEQQEQNKSGLSFSQHGYRFESFKDHQNVIKKVPEKKSEKDKGNKRLNDEIQEFEKPEQIVPIYEEELNQIVLELVKRQIEQFSAKSIFNHINPESYLKDFRNHINTIHYNQKLPKNLQLTKEQIEDHKNALSQQILRISAPNQVFYPSQSQELKLVFLPQTSMIVLLYKHEIILINPCNLASWKLHYLALPASKVKKIILTRFSMAFVQFFIAWGNVRKENPLHTFVQIATLQHIYLRIKLTLKKVFLWTDEMISSRIAFRIISQSKGKYQVLDIIKISYSQTQTRQDMWLLKFARKGYCFMNELIIYDPKLSKEYEYIIFDKINEDAKKSLHEMSASQESIRKKFIYNRSSSSKYRSKYFLFLEENNPIITISTELIVAETFFPYFSSKLDDYRHQILRLWPGEAINCSDRNILIVEGLVLVLYEKVKIVTEQGSEREIVETEVQVCWPADMMGNGACFPLEFIKIRNVKQLVCLKKAVILVQQTQNQLFYINSLGRALHQQHHLPTPKIPFIQHSTIKISELQLQDLSSNTLVKLLSKTSSNLKSSHVKSIQIAENEKSEQKFCVVYQSAYHEFSDLFKKVTFESGQMINADNSKVYFVLKGLLKWDDRNDEGPKAKSNAFIGNLGKFYEELIKKENKQISFEHSEDTQILPIKVVKDTYVLEADIQQLYERFFIRYPEVAYWIIEKGNLFY